MTLTSVVMLVVLLIGAAMIFQPAQDKALKVIVKRLDDCGMVRGDSSGKGGAMAIRPESAVYLGEGMDGHFWSIPYQTYNGYLDGSAYHLGAKKVSGEWRVVTSDHITFRLIMGCLGTESDFKNR